MIGREVMGCECVGGVSKKLGRNSGCGPSTSPWYKSTARLVRTQNDPPFTESFPIEPTAALSYNERKDTSRSIHNHGEGNGENGIR